MIVEFNLNKSEFLFAIKENAKLCGINKILPVFDSILVEVKKDCVITTSSDNFSRVRCKTPLVSPIEEEVRFCVNGNDLVKAVSVASDEIFKMKFDELNDKLEVRYNNGKIALTTAGSDFPEENKPSNEVTISVPTADFLYMVNVCKRHTTNDEMRPVMKGIYMNIEGDTLEFCATNAHTLITEKIKLSKPSDEARTIITNSAILDRFQNVFFRQENISIKIGENTMKIYDKNIILSIALIDGKFPNFKLIASKPDNAMRFTVNKDEFLQSVKNIQIANNATLTSKIECGADKILVSAEDVDYGRKAVERVAAKGDGTITFGCNYKLLESCIRSINSDTIAMCATEPNKAVFFEDSSKESKVILMMPCML